MTTGMSEFLEVFGKVTIADLFRIGLAICFILLALDKLSKHLKERQAAESKKIKHMEDIVVAVGKIPKIEESILKLEDRQKASLKRLDVIEENTRRRERASFKDRLLQSYRFYSSKEHNPLQQWTRMEADAFNELYDEYMLTGDDDHFRNEVKPLMDGMHIIEMYDQNAIIQLMQSRK